MILFSISLKLTLVGIIIAGGATIATLIMMILSLVNHKNKKAIYLGIGFIISTSVLIISIVKMVERIQQKVVSGVEWMVKHEEGAMIDTDYQFRIERQQWIDTLKSYVSDTYKDQIPSEFYNNKVAGESVDGGVELPFIYPYSIQYNPTSRLGQLIVTSRDTVFLENISQLAFDANFIIARIDNSNASVESGNNEGEYILFDMRSGEYLPSVSQEQLIDKANKIGYTGSMQLEYLSYDYRAWFDGPEWD